MTNLSSIPGFSTASSGGGGGGGGSTTEYAGTFTLDSKSFDLQDEGKYLNVTNMTSYFQSMRIRGFDNSSKAYLGSNCMVRTGSSTGNMQHCFTLFSVNQTSGAISKEQTHIMHNNTAVQSDYSTYNKTSDEWTGRYSYQGHIPCNNQGHNYSYHQCLVTNTSGGKASNHVSRSTYYPQGNVQTHNSYVAPTERRHGGAVRHFLGAYDASASKAHVLEYYYNYSTSSLNASRTDSKPFSTSVTSTNYMVPLYCQWDVNTQPYYDAFHSFSEGLYAHNRSADTWNNLGAGYGLSTNYYAFFLSNGNILLGKGSQTYLINTGGSVSTVAKSTQQNPFSIVSLSQYTPMCWNVGEDEWLQCLPGGQFSKFKINPSTGASTMSDVLTVTELKYAGYSNNYQYESGFFSSFSPSNVSPGSYTTTFGNESSSGSGYGKSKLVHIGGSDSDKKIHLATYDLAGLLTQLSY